MRALIAAGGVGDLSSAEVGAILARAWVARGATVAVVPMAERGPELAEALAVLGYTRPVVDLAAGVPDDLAAGTVGVADARQVTMPLVGVHGVAAARGRDEGWPLERVLAEDERWSAWASEVWPGNDEAALQPGSGAHEGRGLRVLAAGGELMTGPQVCADAAGLSASAKRADVIVTSCDTLDYGTFGGEVVAELVRAANAALRPLVAVVGRNFVSSRELRNLGIEAAHAVRTDDCPVEEDSLARLADRVSGSWCWDR